MKQTEKMSKLKVYTKKIRAAYMCVAICVIFLTCITACGTTRHNSSSQEDVKTGDDSGIIIETSFFESDVMLVANPVVEYMSNEINIPASKIYEKYKGDGRIDVGLPVTFSFDVRGLPDNVTVKQSELYIAEDEFFTNPMIYPFDSHEGSASIEFLKTGTQYYYHLMFMLSNGTTTTTQGSFRTADTPRILSVDGIANVRDIGGWLAEGGRRVKQGLLYRGTELDGAIEKSFLLTADGMQDMLVALGICTDMDLRSPADNRYGTNALGNSVEHIYYNAPMYVDVFADGYKQIVRELFSDLADKNKYPVYLHCTYGMDRTGTMCYLLEALLGVEDEDLMRDYQLSALYHGYVSEEEMTEFVNQLQMFEGSTTQQKTENYLLSIGVTPGEIQSIRNIFLGE